MTTQEFIYRGIPKAQGRPKFYRRGNFVGAYDPKDSRTAKNNVACQVLEQGPRLIGQGIPVSLNLKFFMPRPKTHYDKTGQVREKFRDMPHVSRPDLDNLKKLILDSLKGIVYHDDSQIYHSVATKMYGDEPMVRIEVTEI